MRDIKWVMLGSCGNDSCLFEDFVVLTGGKISSKIGLRFFIEGFLPTLVCF